MTTERDIELLDRRVERLETNQHEQDKRLVSVESYVANERVKHASTPAWLFGVLAAVFSGAMLLLQLYMAGVR